LKLPAASVRLAAGSQKGKPNMSDILKHRRRPRRKTRQPISTPLSKSKPQRAKAVLAAIFCGWEDLPLRPLEERVDEARRTAFCRHLSCAEWNALDAMRDKMRALQKFEKAVREVRHV
jgi:hypothetical protein